MEFNFLAILASSIVTLAVGFVWYHPKVFGTIWINEAGLSTELLEKSNMLKTFGLTVVYSFLLAFLMPQLVNHEMGVVQAAGGNALDPAVIDFLKIHHGKFLSFKHGALHGAIAGVFLALPINAINGLFELKSWKYIAINSGYWIIAMTIMGAIICGWQ